LEVNWYLLCFFTTTILSVIITRQGNPNPSRLVLPSTVSDPTTAVDKIRKYRTDYNYNPPNTISFMPAIPSTSGRLHSEFVCLLFLHAHQETDLFYTSSGVHLV
jgi:hypothetical protein